MSSAASVSERVAGWKELSAFAHVNAKVRKWLVASSAVDHLAPHNIFRLARANGGAESLNLPENVWILPKSSFAEGTEEEKRPLLIKM